MYVAVSMHRCRDWVQSGVSSSLSLFSISASRADVSRFNKLDADAGHRDRDAILNTYIHTHTHTQARQRGGTEEGVTEAELAQLASYKEDVLSAQRLLAKVRLTP